MQESVRRICYDGDLVCRVHHTVGHTQEYALMSQFSRMLLLFFGADTVKYV